MTGILQSDTFTFILLPLFIFFARICDVTLDTIRIIFVSKGMRKFAPLIGFFEILIWLMAISKIMQNLDNWACYVAYAGGFATGNFVGMLIEEKLAIGHEMIRVITRADASELIKNLREKGYGITSVKAEGAEGEVGILYIIARRSMIKAILGMINEHNPGAFYTIESIKYVNKSVFHKTLPNRKPHSLFRGRKK
jgi:uncharacterized protein YebE (UPF0316 family)